MKEVAIIIPAYNEEQTIKNVILDFWSFKDKNNYNYKIYVIDNNSYDKTSSIAKDTFKINDIKGEVLFVKQQGKANAIKYAFNKIIADAYIMIDADSTYWANDLDKFLDLILNQDVDMVVGDRISSGNYVKENKRAFHSFGNNLVKNIINYIFKSKLKDILSGYRGFSKKLIKNYPILCEGFELETDVSIFCLEHKFELVEIPIKFTDRPSGSLSKLNTYKDGFKVIMTIFNLFRNYKPLQFFGLIGLFFMIIGVLCGLFPVVDYLEYRYVNHIPLAILSVGLIVSAFLSFSIALILGSVRKYYNMTFELWQLKNQ